MNYAKMQPTPSYAHGPTCICADKQKDETCTAHTLLCTCAELPDSVPCYVWIHLAAGTDRVVTFESLAAAYAWAEKYMFTDCACLWESVRDLSRGGDDPVWTAADGAIWTVRHMTWNTSLCLIKNNISRGVKPWKDHWMMLSTDRHQVLLGLGVDLPVAEKAWISPFSYTLEAHDQPDDMPPLIYVGYDDMPALIPLK